MQMAMGAANAPRHTITLRAPPVKTVYALPHAPVCVWQYLDVLVTVLILWVFVGMAQGRPEYLEVKQTARSEK